VVRSFRILPRAFRQNGQSRAYRTRLEGFTILRGTGSVGLIPLPATLKRSVLSDTDLPIPAFPALSLKPEKCKFDNGIAWKLLGLQISKPQI